MEMIEVLVPVAEEKREEIKIAPRPSDLNGKVMGLMWNKKFNGDLLLKNLGKALEKKFPLSGTLLKSKSNPTSAAPTELIEEFSAQCDLVILAIAD